MLAGLEGDLQRGLWARALADCFRRELERLSVGDPALDIVQTSFATQLSQVSFAKMVMGLRPTLHHENRLSSPLRRRPATSMMFGISSPRQN